MQGRWCTRDAQTLRLQDRCPAELHWHSSPWTQAAEALPIQLLIVFVPDSGNVQTLKKEELFLYEIGGNIGKHWLLSIPWASLGCIFTAVPSFAWH